MANCSSDQVKMSIINYFDDGWEAISSQDLQTARIQFQYMIESIRDRSIREVGLKSPEQGEDGVITSIIFCSN